MGASEALRPDGLLVCCTGGSSRGLRRQGRPQRVPAKLIGVLARQLRRYRTPRRVEECLYRVALVALPEQKSRCRLVKAPFWTPCEAIPVPRAARQVRILQHPSAPGRPYGFVALFIITASSYLTSTAT